MPSTARFTEVVPQRRLVLACLMDFNGAVEPYELDLEVELVAEGELVTMIVTTEASHSAEFSRMALAGFASQLTKLDARFTSVAPSRSPR